jgi:signal peptidase II
VAAIVVAVVAIDQLTKWCVRQTLELHEPIPVIDGLFNLTYVRNPGAAFGLLSGLPPALRGPLFIIVSLGALIVLGVILAGLHPGQRGLRIAIAAVLGGAVGNLIDRVVEGEVIDFLDVHWRGYHWPAFNVADSCISVGVVVLLILSFRRSPAPAAPRGSGRPRGRRRGAMRGPPISTPCWP